MAIFYDRFLVNSSLTEPLLLRMEREIALEKRPTRCLATLGNANRLGFAGLKPERS